MSSRRGIAAQAAVSRVDVSSNIPHRTMSRRASSKPTSKIMLAAAPLRAGVGWRFRTESSFNVVSQYGSKLAAGCRLNSVTSGAAYLGGSSFELHTLGRVINWALFSDVFFSKKVGISFRLGGLK